jgi:hypothetical protein
MRSPKVQLHGVAHVRIEQNDMIKSSDGSNYQFAVRTFIVVGADGEDLLRVQCFGADGAKVKLSRELDSDLPEA